MRRSILLAGLALLAAPALAETKQVADVVMRADRIEQLSATEFRLHGAAVVKIHDYVLASDAIDIKTIESGRSGRAIRAVGNDIRVEKDTKTLVYVGSAVAEIGHNVIRADELRISGIRMD